MVSKGDENLTWDEQFLEEPSQQQQGNGNGTSASPPVNGNWQVKKGDGLNGSEPMKATSNGVKMEYRITKEDFGPLLPVILPIVTTALKEPSRPDEYMMRLMLRICSFCRDGMGPHIESVLPSLVSLLVAATANPSNPLFNHYLFETFAALIRFNANMNTVGAFEAALMTPLCNVLIADVTEFGPYVFQVLAQMLSVHRPSPTPSSKTNGNNVSKQISPTVVPEQYTGLMNPTLIPTMWDRRAYIAAMVQYIEPYLGVATARLIDDKQLEPTLGVFQKLIASKATDHHGLHLLSCIFECIDLNTLGPYVQTIASALMMGMSRAKTSKYVYGTLVALSTFVLRFRFEALRNAFDNVQKDLLGMFIKQVWLPDVVKIRDISQRRICALGLTELFCGSGDICVHEPYRSLWAEMINANIALVEGIIVDDQGTAEREREALAEEEAEEVGVLVGAAETYASSQSLLRWGIGMKRNMNVVDSITNGQDTRAVVFVKVSAFIARHKTRLLSKNVESGRGPQAREALSTYESVAKRGIVAKNKRQKQKKAI